MLVLAFSMGTGCSGYVQRSSLIKQALVRDEFDHALKQIEKINRNTSELLYLYEKGLILHRSDRYAESNDAFEQAEILTDDLYTKSITREILALALADPVAKYRGEAFETVYVNYYKMLNYTYLGQFGEALVECRSLNEKIKFLGSSEDSVFVTSPFLEWLTGMLFQANGAHNDADVSFRRAVDSYEQLFPVLGVPQPGRLACDLVDNARWLGDLETVERYKSRCTTGSPRQADANRGSDDVGSLTLFVECGYVASKVAHELVLPIYKEELDRKDFDTDAFTKDLARRRNQPRRHNVKIEYLLKVSIPEIVTSPIPWRNGNVRAVSATDTLLAPLELVDDLNAWAVRSFDKRRPKILFRTILRGLTKYLATRETKKGNEPAGWLVNLVGLATETADTRSWSTLPSRIFVTRVELPKGSWDLQVQLDNGSGRVAKVLTIPNIVLEAGHHRFLNYRLY